MLAWSVVGGIGNGAYGMAFLTVVQERTTAALRSADWACPEPQPAT